LKPVETIDYNIKVAWLNINRMYNTVAYRHGISTAIGFVLLNIDDRTGSPATKLPSLLGLEPNSLSRLLKSMEEKGLIRREADQNDKRMVRVWLTDLGKEKREISRLTVRKFNEQMMEHFSPEKMETFFEVLREINYLLENKHLLETTGIRS
jgi:DNA-binding MarR family transcriptional regulator